MPVQQAAEAAKYLGETSGFWIQTVAVFLSAVATCGLLFYTSRQVRLLVTQMDRNELQDRRRATIDVVLNEKSDPEFQAARKALAEMHETKVNFTSLACQKLVIHSDENKTILCVLNQYEFIASAIREGAFDEGVYRRMKESLLIRDWDALTAYVHELRRANSRPNLYSEFEWLATSWKKTAKP